MRVLLAVGMVLLVPGAAHAAGAQLRLLNAAVSGKITIAVDGKTEFSRVKLGRTTRRHSIRAGRHVITAQIGKGKSKRVIASLRVALRSRERATIVYTLKGRRPSLFVFIEPTAVRSAIIFRAANFASAAGTVSLRIGSTVVAKRLRFGGVTAARQLVPASSPTGVLKVSARRGKRTMTAHDPLVLATGSVGLFVVIPRGRKAQVVRLPYTTPVPAPTHQPKLIGSRRFDHTLRCTADGWRPKGAVVKKLWMVDGHVVGSGVSRTLTTAEDAGHKIACSVSATLNHMTTTVVVAFNLPAVPKIVTLPSVKAPKGALAAGQTVTCDHGVWSSAPTTYAYRWFRKVNDVPIGSGRTYKLTLPADNGAVNALGCDVIATNNGGVSADLRSSNTVALGIAPTVAIDASSKPLNPTTLQTANFTWSIGGGGADTVQCQLDGGPLGTCAGPLLQTYGAAQLTTSVAGNSHTFTVKATNPVSTATATYTWTVNPVAPAVTITPASKPANPTLSPSAAFTWTAGGGPRTISCTLDTNTIPCTTLTSASLSNLATDVNGTSHTFTVTATNVTNTASDSYTWTVNPPAPTVAIDANSTPANPTASTSANFTFTPGGGPHTVSCTIDNTPTTCGATSASLTGLPTDPNGVSHTFTVTVKNATAPAGVSDSYTWTVLPVPALSNLAVNPGDGATSAGFTLTFSSAATATFTCQLDGGATAACSSGDSFPDPLAGLHTMKVVSTNGSGTDTQSISWTFL